MIPVKYRRSKETAIATYDYTDIAEGTGVVTFYGMNTQASTALTSSYALTTNSNIGSKIAWIKTAAGAGTTPFGDYDFETTFNMPKTIKGNIVGCIPIGWEDDAVQKNIKITIKVYHYDGTTATLIGQNHDQSITQQAELDERYQYLNIMIPVTETNFSAGDTLRINVELGGNADQNRYLGLDPLNRANGTILVRSRMSFLIPFKLNNL